MLPLSDDRERIHRELRSILESIETTAEPDGSLRLTGSMRFGASLVGPKDRLHGGLHAYARTLAVLEALASRGAHDSATTYPVHLVLTLNRPLPLETSAPFEGHYRADSDGYELVTDFAEREKLRARATRSPDPHGPLAWFRDAVGRTEGREPIHTIKAQTDVPMHVFDEIIVAPIDQSTRGEASRSYARFVESDGSITPAAVCVFIDLLGAVTQGYAWKSRIFTTRMDVVLTSPSIPGDVDLLAISDRDGQPDPESLVRPAPTKDGMSGPIKVRVMLVDRALERVYAHGTITLIPAPGELPVRR